MQSKWRSIKQMRSRSSVLQKKWVECGLLRRQERLHGCKMRKKANQIMALNFAYRSAHDEKKSNLEKILPIGYRGFSLILFNGSGDKDPDLY